MVYLLLGDNEEKKQARIDQFKQACLAGCLEQFNYENLASKGLTVKDLQEALSRLPTQGVKKRLVLIRDAQRLKPQVKEFLIAYSGKPFSHVVLVLTAGGDGEQDKAALAYSAGNIKIEKIGFARKNNAFDLGRAVAGKDIDAGLRLLNYLLHKGESPERILGALRYQLMKDSLADTQRQRNLSALLGTELDIKTGRLRPALALEKLVIKLCCF